MSSAILFCCRISSRSSWDYMGFGNKKESIKISENMNNDFDKCMQIAEFAQKNQHDRRAYEYKIFISYVTLLVLGIWKADAISIHCYWGIAVVLGSYLAYLLWCVRLAVANHNDQFRRDWYLMAAECRLYLSNNVKRVPSDYTDKSEDRINEESKWYQWYKKWCQSNSEEDKIKRVPKFWQFWKGWCQFLGNWSIWFTALFPVLLVIWLTLRLCCCYPWVML